MVVSPKRESLIKAEDVESVRFEIVQILVVCQIPCTEDRQPDGKSFSYLVGALKQFIARDAFEVLGREIGWDFVHGFLDVRDLERPGKRVRHFDIPIFVEEDVAGTDIAQLFSRRLGLNPGFGQPPQQEPDFDFSEATLLAPTVVDLFGQQVGVVRVIELGEQTSTVAVPVFPHMAVRLNSALMGRSRFEGGEEYLLEDSFHLSNSFSSIPREVCRRFSSPSETILLLEKRGWLISISNSFFC